MKKTISVNDILGFNSCAKNPEEKMRKVWSDMGKGDNADVLDVFNFPIDYPDFFILLGCRLPPRKEPTRLGFSCPPE